MTEHPANPPIALPDSIRAEVAGYRWWRVNDGESGGDVFRLEAPGQRSLYLKCGRDHVADDISAESSRLEWLAARVAVPAVVAFSRTEREAFLLTTAIPGVTAHEELVSHPERQLATVAAIATFLRQLHALPAADCPFDAGHESRLAAAKGAMDAGLVDESDFDECRQGLSAEQVWQDMNALLPLPFKRVVTHGDFSLGNILMQNGHVVGCIDVGRAGVADPYQDLAILANNLSDFGADLEQQLFQSYGQAVPDAQRMTFHLCLDEFF